MPMRVGFRFIVFDTPSNKIRLVAESGEGQPQYIYIRHVLAHAEYDKGPRKGRRTATMSTKVKARRRPAAGCRWMRRWPPSTPAPPDPASGAVAGAWR